MADHFSVHHRTFGLVCVRAMIFELRDFFDQNILAISAIYRTRDQVKSQGQGQSQEVIVTEVKC